MAPDSATGPDPWPPAAARIVSIDALRGFVMFMMIFVNDLVGAPRRVVPDWMAHFSDRHKSGSGMTFVDLVFPAFLFIVGMSIPFALGQRLRQDGALWKTILHVLTRTLALLALGILMVNNEEGGTELWAASMFLCAIFAFCAISPRGAGPDTQRFWKIFTRAVRVLGGAGLIYLAFTFSGENDRRLITLSPFSIHTSWYGILGIIGWAYLVGSLVFLLFRGHRTALLGCAVLLLCLYPADRTGLFDNIRLARYVGIGELLGAHPSITVAGLLLASCLSAPDLAGVRPRVRFTLWFSAGFAVGAWLLHGLYGISKNAATTSWCLWACAITAALWLAFYFLSDVRPVGFISKPLALAGRNVLLAYLLSEMIPSPLNLIHLGVENHLAWVVARSAAWSIILLCATAGLNRLGFRLKL